MHYPEFGLHDNCMVTPSQLRLRLEELLDEQISFTKGMVFDILLVVAQTDAYQTESSATVFFVRKKRGLNNESRGQSMVETASSLNAVVVKEDVNKPMLE